MLKNILKLDGAQKLSKNEQKEINGGKLPSAPRCDISQGAISPSPMSVNQCVCLGGGIYNYNTQRCSNGSHTGNVWENATGCCYNF